LLVAFNLINGVDIPETEARIAAYRAENAALIELNIQREQDYANALKEQEELERREREQRALDLRLEEEGERQEREHERQKIIDRLESSDKDASEVIKKARAKMRKNLRREEEERKAQAQARLLRSRTVKGVAVKDVPHVPLTDNYYAYEDAFQLLQTYNDLASDAVRYDREGIMRAGGYIVSQAWERAIRTSVAGLDIMPLEGLPSTEPADVAMAS
jgi:CDK-activating kinase assembly factor MAT1